VRKRIGIAVLLVAGIYALALGVGGALYATGAIATGATHNDCADFRHVIAVERGIDEHDVSQSEIGARTQECLDGHELTKGEAFRSEYLFWAAWPGVICAVIFLAWPAWARTLRNQDLADAVRDAANLESGT
jgi:hypothetical protein